MLCPLTPALCLEIGRYGLLNVALHSGTGFNFYTARKSYAFDLACLHFDLTFSQLETESLACQSDSAVLNYWRSQGLVFRFEFLF